MTHDIPNDKLILERMPNPDGDFTAIINFALTFDGYEYWGKDCLKIGDLVGEYYGEHGYLPDGLNVSDLRACLFYAQRCWRNAGQVIGFVNDNGEILAPKPETEGIENMMRYLVSRITKYLFEKKQHQQKINSLTSFLKVGIINAKQMKQTVKSFEDYDL